MMTPDIDKIKFEIEQYGMEWVKNQPVEPMLTESDITVSRVMAVRGYKDPKTARKWLRENGFSESHMARYPDNNRLVMVWGKKCPRY